MLVKGWSTPTNVPQAKTKSVTQKNPTTPNPQQAHHTSDRFPMPGVLMSDSKPKPSTTVNETSSPKAPTHRRQDEDKQAWIWKGETVIDAGPWGRQWSRYSVLVAPRQRTPSCYNRARTTGRPGHASTVSKGRQCDGGVDFVDHVGEQLLIHERCKVVATVYGLCPPGAETI
jgi:hypothetical protein